MPHAKTGYLTETDRVIRKAEYLKWVAANLEFSNYDRRMFNFMKSLSKQQPNILRKLKFVPSNRSAPVRMTIASDSIAPSKSVCEIVDNREREGGRILRIEHDPNQIMNFIKHCTDEIYVEMLYPGQDSCSNLFSVIEYIPTLEDDIQIQYLFARDADKLIAKVTQQNKENILKARVDNAIDTKDQEKFLKAALALKKFREKAAKKIPNE